MVFCLSKVWTGWVRICSIINRFFEKCFINWTGIVGNNPWKVIGIGFLIALALMAGFARFNIQSQTERLYFPQHSQTADDLVRADKSFPAKAKPDEFIITMQDGVSSILHRKALSLALKLHKQIMETTAIDTICIKARTSPCLLLSPLELFNYNDTLIQDNSIQMTIVNALNDHKRLMATGRNVALELRDFLGQVNVDQSNKTISASALRVLYYITFPEDDEVHKRVSDVQKVMIDILQQGVKEAKADGMKMYLLTGRSVDDGISESSGGDISLVAVSITLMCTFATMILICVRDHVSGHVLLGLVGIGCIAIGIGSGFGLVMLSGQYFVAFVGTLPFLVLGVGIDDMFIMIDALDSMPSEITGIERLKKTMAKVGASVTMTTVTDIVAFAISSSSDFPAIRYFCFYAMTTIFVSFLLLMTVFLAVMALDVKRIEKGKWDMVVCKTEPNYIPWKKTISTLSKRIMKKWAEFLMKTPVRIIVIVISLGLLGAGIYGTTILDEKFDVKQLAPDGSYFIDFLDIQRKYFPVSYTVNIINDDATFDYTNIEQQKNYLHLDTICKENAYLKDTTINWMGDFINSTTYAYNSSQTFYQNLNIFLAQNPYYEVDLKRDANTGRILFSRIVCEDKDTDDWQFRKKSMLGLRKDLEEKSKIKSVFPISLNYFYREQIVSVRPETIQNLALCSIAILIITTPYLVHPLVILFVFGGFVALIFELFGLMVIWDVSLNSISMITSIMAIGFAVDYSAHVAHSFLLANGNTPEERMIEALKSIGASVFMGGFTTFLGILVLIFGSSEIFRIFFKMVLGIVVLGLLNGLVFLPVYLSIFVRTKVKIREDDAEDRIYSTGKEMNNKVEEVNVNVIVNEHSPKKVATNNNVV